MIYYKKKSWIKKIFNKIVKFPEMEFSIVFCFFRNLLLTLFILFSFIYLACLFVLPKYINENNVSSLINSQVLKESELVFEAKNLRILPNYKLEINLKADSIKIKKQNKDDFLVLDNASLDINCFSLFKNFIDLNRIKVDKVQINSAFLKNKTTLKNKFIEGKNFAYEGLPIISRFLCNFLDFKL